ncbi:MAG: polysaccharide deacetylase family protein [Chloroflexi bacterium]|nr:polysaccharide deacetylase family protein [Chloroflexota bacterium]
MNRMLMTATRSPALAAFVSLLEHIRPAVSTRFHVLTYHRVDEVHAHPERSPALLSATPAEFEQQMRYLSACCQVISSADLVRIVEAGRPLPPRTVLITFDDAYTCFAEHAFPIMQRYGLPVTLFVPTAFPDQPERIFWWDQLYHAIFTTRCQCVQTPVGELQLEMPAQRRQAFKALREYVKSQPHERAMQWVSELVTALDVAPLTQGAVLSWAQLRALAKAGVTLCPHTRTHPLLNRISAEAACAEAVGALRDLELQIGSTLPVIAYPGGGISDAVTQVLRQEGFVLGYTTQRGSNDVRTLDNLQIRRINIGRSTSLTALRAQLL